MGIFYTILMKPMCVSVSPIFCLATHPGVGGERTVCSLGRLGDIGMNVAWPSEPEWVFKKRLAESNPILMENPST